MPDARMVCTADAGDGRTISASWAGGKAIVIWLMDNGRPLIVDRWPIWNDAWDAPLIRPELEPFRRFVAARLAEPGMLERLTEPAAG